MMNTDRICVGYPPARTAEADAAGMERLFTALFGNMDEDEREDFAAQHRERRLAHRDAALKSARAQLRKSQHPVRRPDMVLAMEEAVMHQVSNYEKLPSIANAVSLVATVICKNILMDGPLHEEA